MEDIRRERVILINWMFILLLKCLGFQSYLLLPYAKQNYH